MKYSLDKAKENDLDALVSLMRENYLFDNHSFDKIKATIAMNGLLGNKNYGIAWHIMAGRSNNAKVSR